MSARILIVEDELVVARGIGEMLTRFGYAVVGTADRGEEAVDLAGRLAPDLILMDIVLAGTMDGVEAAREIRERFAVPVVYMTANADMGTVARARDTAPYGYVLKPVERLHLFSTIDTAVNKHALERRLVESERTARALLDASRDRAFLIGRDYVILGLNIVAAQAVGMRADEAIGRSILDLVPPDLAASRKPHLDRALATGMAVTFEDERGGVLLEHHIYPIRDERGATAQIAIFARDVTIERRAQEAIRKSEERYRRIVETAAEGVWSMDGDRVTTFVNRQMAEMLGRPAVDIVGKRVTDFMFPEDLAEHERRMEGRARGEGGRYEQRFRRADGSTLWCLVSATALAGDDGSFHGSFAMFTDITQRKQAEERLQNNQRILFSLLNATTDSAALLDVDGVTLMENDAFRLDFGDDYSVLIERAVPEAPQGPIVRGAVSRVEAVVATGRPVNFMLRRDNRHFDVTLYPIVDANRFVVNIALFAHDITTIVRAEQELRASEEKFRCLFEDSSDAQALLDRFAVVDCNGAAAQLLEYGGARDLVGKSLYDCSPEVQPDGIFSEAKGDLVSRRLAEEGSFRFEWELVRRGGSSFIVEVYATRIRLGSRTVVHAAFRDITERKRLQNEIIRIIDIEQERLGRDLHDGIGQELTGIAFLGASLAKRLKDSAHPLAGDAEEVVRHVYEVISRTRGLSRELYPPTLVENDMVYAVRDFVEGVRTVFSVECEFEMDPGLSVTDKTASAQLYFIVREAVNNAIRHGNPKRIAIRLTSEGENGTLVIEDNGAGPPETLDAATGLGLRIMKYRMESLSGTARFYRNESGGATVHCTFPLSAIE